MRLIAVATAALLVGAASTSIAQVAEDKNGWLCGEPDDWEIAAVRPAPKLILNNFFFNEKNSFRTKMKVLEVKYSAINRETKSYSMTGQFIGFDPEGEVTFALSVSPSMDMAKSGTETAEDDVYITDPVLTRTSKICASFAVESGRK